MSFTVQLANVPEGGDLWYPTFVIPGIPEGYYPDEWLSVSEPWVMPYTLGGPMEGDLSLAIVNADYNMVYGDSKTVTIDDGDVVTFDVAGEEEGLPTWAWVGAALVALVLLVKRK